MKVVLKILRIVGYFPMALFSLIGLSALFFLMVEGDWMNLIGVVSGFALAWMCWPARIS